MFVATFFDAGVFQYDLCCRAVGASIGFIKDLDAFAGNNCPVAFFKIGHCIGHRGESDGIGADEHFTIPVADGQRRPFARRDQKIVLAIKQETQGKGPVQPPQSFARRVNWGQACVKVALGENGHRFGIGLGLEHITLGEQFITQIAEIFDYAVMYHGDSAGLVRVGVGNGGCAMCGPTGVANP